MSRIEDLRKKLRAREGIPGYEKNCEALRAEISRLDDQTKASDDPFPTMASKG